MTADSSPEFWTSMAPGLAAVIAGRFVYFWPGLGIRRDPFDFDYRMRQQLRTPVVVAVDTAKLASIERKTVVVAAKLYRTGEIDIALEVPADCAKLLLVNDPATTLRSQPEL